MRKLKTSAVSRLTPAVVEGVILAAIWLGSAAAIWGLARLGDPTVDTGALLAVAVSGGAVIAGLVTSLLTNERR
jgi:fucose permease